MATKVEWGGFDEMECEGGIKRVLLLGFKGQPPDYMLKEAKNTSKFFKYARSVNHEESGANPLHRSRVYEVLTEEDYEARDTRKPAIGKEYFNHKNLEAIVRTYPYKKNLPQEELIKESQMRLALVDFLRGLVEFDPAKRWSPLQASKHPFLTGEPFTSPYKPAPETPSVGSNISKEEEQYGWGIGSTVTMVIVVLCIFFLPLVMGPVQPPPPIIFLAFPILAAVILINFSRLVELRTLLDKMKELDGNLPDELEDIIDKNVNVEEHVNMVEEDTDSDSVVSAENNDMTEVDEVTEKLEMNSSKDHKEIGLKRKHRDSEVSVQSKEMLKIRAALEEKLKKNGVFTSLAQKNDKRKKHQQPLNGQLETRDDFDDDAIGGDSKGRSSKISQLTSQAKKPKLISGDDDLPKRDDIGERRRKHEMRVLSRAGIEPQDEAQDEAQDEDEAQSDGKNLGKPTPYVGT